MTGRPNQLICLVTANGKTITHRYEAMCSGKHRCTRYGTQRIRTSLQKVQITPTYGHYNNHCRISRNVIYLSACYNSCSKQPHIKYMYRMAPDNGWWGGGGGPTHHIAYTYRMVPDNGWWVGSYPHIEYMYRMVPDNGWRGVLPITLHTRTEWCQTMGGGGGWVPTATLNIRTEWCQTMGGGWVPTPTLNIRTEWHQTMGGGWVPTPTLNIRTERFQTMGGGWVPTPTLNVHIEWCQTMGGGCVGSYEDIAQHLLFMDNLTYRAACFLP